jgi:hypothetical protein
MASRREAEQSKSKEAEVEVTNPFCEIPVDLLILKCISFIRHFYNNCNCVTGLAAALVRKQASHHIAYAGRNP